VPALRGRPAEKVEGGREIPAKPGHPDLRVYTGSVKASLEERMKWLETSGAGVHTARQVVLADAEPFDLNTATLDEMIEFAKTEYGKTLDKSMGMKAVRAAVGKLATEAGAVREESLG
jgi:hypothetical protein